MVADEADAGFVYATDAVAAGDDVETVELPGRRASTSRRTPWRCSSRPGSRSWPRSCVDLVLGPDGQRVLADAGFGQP